MKSCLFFQVVSIKINVNYSISSLLLVEEAINSSPSNMSTERRNGHYTPDVVFNNLH